MRCQLARIIQPEDYDVSPHLIGLLVWTDIGPPKYYSLQCLHIETGANSEIIRPVILAVSERGCLVVTTAVCLELLPYFDDVVPIHYKDWIARGGDSLPLGKTGN